MAIIQTQSQKQTQKLTFKQIQLFNIVALHTVELEQYIANEMAANPALEFDTEQTSSEEDSQAENDNSNDQNEDFVSEGKLGEDYDYTDYMDKDSLDDYKYEVNNNGAEDDKREQIILESNHFTKGLISQLGMLSISEKEKQLGIYLIESLDDDGYLRRDISELADELSFQHNMIIDEVELTAVLDKIKQFDPLGIAAKDLQECLLLQLKGQKQQTKDTFNAINILKNFMQELSARKFDLIRTSLKISEEDFTDALSEIKSLNPKPAGIAHENSNKAVTIIPDFSVQVDGTHVELYLNQAKQPALKISEEYTEMLNDYSKSKDKNLKEASTFIKDKVESAKWFIEALQQRESMMVLVAKAIVKHQKQYFITGNKNDLKALILKNIAEEIGSEISTVSRIANSKYIATSMGNILIKDLFVQGMTDVNGEIVSTNEIKQVLVNCIEAEDKTKPLSDEEIVKLLEEKNYVISRRTIAKYRDELKIPNKNFRKITEEAAA
ncbi:MAG: RNA polymerase factor sigma-54 [Bacteroidia bacterium]